jgi:hypothetical protein
MTNDHPLGDRGRSLEEDYFRQRDRELIEKLQRAKAAHDARQELSATSGLQDPELLDELQALGFTPQSVSLLPLVPLIEMAWAEGGVSAAERDIVIKLARSRGIAEGSAADRQLADWLAGRPAADVFARARRLLRAMLQSPSQEQAAMTADELVKYCEDIAAASGGLFGLNRISASERALLAEIAANLESPPNKRSS